MKSFSAKANQVGQEWHIIDAQDQVLGRLASFIATRLRGKHRPEFTPHIDTGDYIVVVNADQIKVTGNKYQAKKYYRHSGYPGGIYVRTFKEMQNKKPGEVLIKAVKGMLPKGPLGYSLLRKLKVYPTSEHPHQAQQPKSLQPLNK